MKKTIIFLFLCLTCKVYADDTAQLQSLINSGNTILPAHHAPYFISSLNLVHSLNANGNVINCTISNNPAIVMNNPGVKFSNGELVGTADSMNPSGSLGVQIFADNDTVSHVYIHKFNAYGILGGDGNLPVIINDKIADIGYAGMFFNSTKHSIKGGIVAFDTLDRSMLNSTLKCESDLMLRGSANYTSSAWKVHDNLMLMFFLPDFIDAECFELRYAPYSLIYNNTCIGGSIGISVVRNEYVKTYHNKCSKQKEEGIEYADSGNGMIRDNIVSDQAKLGVLIDGFAPRRCQYDTLLNNKIIGKDMGVQLYKDTYDIYFSNCTISADSKAINIQGAHGVTLQNCKLSGNTKGATALFLDNSAGKVTMHGGTMNGFHHKFFIYATKPVVTDNILLDGVKATNVADDFDQGLSGGATVGSKIKVK